MTTSSIIIVSNLDSGLAMLRGRGQSMPLLPVLDGCIILSIPKGPLAKLSSVGFKSKYRAKTIPLDILSNA